MTRSELKKALEWFSTMAAGLDFGEVTLKAVVHDGEIKFFERSVIEKHKPEADR